MASLNVTAPPFINSPLQIGSLTLPNRLIQGPLAGYSCAPFRLMFDEFMAPAYCVSEMCSAQDVLNRHTTHSRYLYRASKEAILAYQISGTDPKIMAQAAQKLQDLGANLIDINCGCPKIKIRKKGAGSALLENPTLLMENVLQIKQHISIPLTVKIRLLGNPQDVILAKNLEEAGADALIVHGRSWKDGYDVACDLDQIALIKQQINIPLIANGDIADSASLNKAMQATCADAYMISRAGCGRPWLYQYLLTQEPLEISLAEKIRLFMLHLHGLAVLENERKAVLQSKSLVRYYFRQLKTEQLQRFYALNSLNEIRDWLSTLEIPQIFSTKLIRSNVTTNTIP